MNKAAKVVIAILSVLIVAAVVSIVIVLNFMTESSADEVQTIDEMNDNSYTTPEVTTDLEDGSFVRIEFQIIADGKKGVNELDKREFQIQNLLIKELSLMSEDDFNSGLSELEETLEDSLNEIMEDGQITDVYTISKILQ